MSTSSRFTYAQWLDALAETGRADDYGMVASAWLAARDHGRPRLSAVKSVNAWLSEHPPPGVANLQAALHRLRQAYGSGNLPPDPAQPPQAVSEAPGAVQPPLFQAPSGYEAQHAAQPVQAADFAPDPAWLPAEYQQAQPAVPAGTAWQDGSPQQPAPPAEQQYTGPAEYQQADSPAEQARKAANDVWLAQQQPAPPAGQPWQQQAPPEHPWQVVMLKLGELETTIAALYRGLEPLMRLAEESEAADAALAASQLAQPSEAQAQALAIAQQQGWTPGPVFEDGSPDIDWDALCPAHCREDRCGPDGERCSCPGHDPGGIHARGLPQGAGFVPQMPPDGPQSRAQPPPDFYGGHVVPAPDFGAMAAASDGEDWEQT